MDKNKEQIEYINAPNLIKDKLGELPELPHTLIELAESTIEKFKIDFPDRAWSSIKDIRHHMLRVKQTPSSAKHREELRVCVHDLKGEGGSYGYPLITRAARCLETHLIERQFYMADSTTVESLLLIMETILSESIEGHATNHPITHKLARIEAEIL